MDSTMFSVLTATVLSFLLIAEGRIMGRRIRNDESCNEPGFFGDTEDCRNFYRCAEHATTDDSPPVYIKYSFRCPSGTVFDESLSTCNHPDAVMDKPGICQIYDPEDEQAAPEPAGGGDPRVFSNHYLIQPQQQQPLLVPQILYSNLAFPYGNIFHYG